MPILKGYPDWLVYAGGGVVLGGGYLLYRKRKAASASATSSVPATSGTDLSTAASGQQSSVVPYYLTGNQSSTDWRNGFVTQGPPLPTPSGTPGGGGSVISGTAIPPILPPTPTTPTPTPPPAPPVPSPAPPAPAPAQNNALPVDLLQRIQAAGESIVGTAAAPGGGAWYAGSKGGVFAVNAPFYGSMFGWLPAGVTVTGIQPQGNGYVLLLSNGDRRPYNV